MPKDYVLLPRQNPNEKPRVKCKSCGKVEEHHAKGFCYRCYKRVGWKREKIVCKNCGRKKYHKAFGLCGSCHTRLHHYEKSLIYNAKRYHGIDYSLYKELTKVCESCDFIKIVQIHHLDGNTRNNDKKNIVGLCPNCHRMIHMYEFYKEIKETLQRKGYDVSKAHPTIYIRK